MENLNPTELNKWITFIWELSWKGLLVFCVIYYRELVIKIIGTFIDILASWLKRK